MAAMLSRPQCVNNTLSINSLRGLSCWYYIAENDKGVIWNTVLGNALQWRHNGLDGVSNHQPHHRLLSHLFGPRSKKTSKLRVTGICAGNSPGTGEFPAQMTSNAENVSIWWRLHVVICCSVSVNEGNSLAHWGGEKLAAIWPTTFSSTFLFNENLCIWLTIDMCSQGSKWQ